MSLVQTRGDLLPAVLVDCAERYVHLLRKSYRLDCLAIGVEGYRQGTLVPNILLQTLVKYFFSCGQFHSRHTVGRGLLPKAPHVNSRSPIRPSVCALG